MLRCFTVRALKMCCFRWTCSHNASPKKDIAALRNWIARLPAPSDVIGGLGGPLGDELETGAAAPRCVWELLVCLASIQKSSTLLSTERPESCASRGLKKCPKCDIRSLGEKQWHLLQTDTIKSQKNVEGLFLKKTTKNNKTRMWE